MGGALVLGSPRCPICDTDFSHRPRAQTCSARCRRERSRRRERERLAGKLRRVREGLLVLRAQVDDVLGKVERTRG
jgi:predicted nucleic acid-binding Zn ribbon protein